MIKILATILAVLVILFFVPLLPYTLLSAIAGLEPPSEDGSPASFILGVLVSKIGTAITFVLLVYFAREPLARRWRLYAGLWFVFFSFGEVGQAIGPNYSWLEALGGVIAEAIYCPLAAWVTQRMLRA